MPELTRLKHSYATSDRFLVVFVFYSPFEYDQIIFGCVCVLLTFNLSMISSFWVVFYSPLNIIIPFLVVFVFYSALKYHQIIFGCVCVLLTFKYDQIIFTCVCVLFTF